MFNYDSETILLIADILTYLGLFTAVVCLAGYIKSRKPVLPSDKSDNIGQDTPSEPTAIKEKDFIKFLLGHDHFTMRMSNKNWNPTTNYTLAKKAEAVTVVFEKVVSALFPDLQISIHYYGDGYTDIGFIEKRRRGDERYFVRLGVTCVLNWLISIKDTGTVTIPDFCDFRYLEDHKVTSSRDNNFIFVFENDDEHLPKEVFLTVYKVDSEPVWKSGYSFVVRMTEMVMKDSMASIKIAPGVLMSEGDRVVFYYDVLPLGTGHEGLTELTIEEVWRRYRVEKALSPYEFYHQRIATEKSISYITSKIRGTDA